MSDTTNNHVTKVAIVGATGTVGSYITSSLLSTGKHEITAITRSDSTSVIPPGIHHVAKIDYSDPSTIVSALRGQQALIITMSTLAPPDTSFKLVEAASAAGVRYVMHNCWCPDFADGGMAEDILLGLGERAVREKIEQSTGTSWLGMITGFWYQYSLGFGGDTYGMEWKDKTMTFFDDGEVKMNTITWDQTGRAVAALLSLPIESPEGKPCLSDYANKFVYTSSFLVSQKDMFASVLRVTGTTEKDWTIRYEPSKKRWEEGRARMKAGDRSGYVQQMYSRVFYPSEDGTPPVANFEARHGLANGVLGLPQEDLDEATKGAIDRAEKGLKYH